jgi:hypothetical protein
LVLVESFCGSMFGCESGCTFFSLSAFFSVSSTRRCVTSIATRSPKRCVRMSRGALPGRKPLTRAVFWSAW